MTIVDYFSCYARRIIITAETYRGQEIFLRSFTVKQLISKELIFDYTLKFALQDKLLGLLPH